MSYPIADLSSHGPFIQEERLRLQLWKFTRATPGTNAFFTSRGGGTSSEPYDSLNLAYHVGDDSTCVTSNRRLLADALALEVGRFTSPHQEHSARVEVVTEANVGSGATSQSPDLRPCDGLVTDLPGAPLILHFADCVPIVLTGRSHDSKPVIGVVHAGRKGLMDGVIGNAVEAITHDLDVAVNTVTAAIGPSIGPCCYEVDESCASAFGRRFGPGSLKERNLDLREAAKIDLQTARIAPANIFVMETCTACDPNFFSYRREGVTGRHSAIAWIGPEG
jgi:hypothetical protein